MKPGDFHLLVGACSLTAAGLVLRSPSRAEALATIFVACLLVAVVYGFNRIADAWYEARARGDSLMEGERAKAARTAVALVPATAIGVLLAASLPRGARIAAAAIAVIGIVYSLGLGRARPKNVPILKNAMIAVPWALLVVVGAGGIRDGVPTLVTFVTLQVFVGSVLRDLDDRSEDAANGVPTLPVLLGERRTMIVLRLVNAASVAVVAGALLLAPRSVHPLAVMLLLAATWRAFSLWWLSLRGAIPALLRAGNLATCHLVFVAVVVGGVLRGGVP